MPFCPGLSSKDADIAKSLEGIVSEQRLVCVLSSLKENVFPWDKVLAGFLDSMIKDVGSLSSGYLCCHTTHQRAGTITLGEVDPRKWQEKTMTLAMAVAVSSL